MSVFIIAVSDKGVMYILVDTGSKNTKICPLGDSQLCDTDENCHGEDTVSHRRYHSKLQTI